MTDIAYTEDQLRAIQDISDWYDSLEWDDGGRLLDTIRTDSSGAGPNQVFRLFGYAGVGKTSVCRAAVDNLGLSAVCYAAYTGKASYVMRKHGLPTARTISSLAYTVREAPEAAVDEMEKRIKEMREESRQIDPQQRPMLDQQIADMIMEVKQMKEPHFMLNPDSAIALCDLLVLDEVSMVNQEMAVDLLSFRKPILVLGDPGQLPPIRGDGFFISSKPNVMLTQIHRQAMESAIIRLAIMARNGEHIPYGSFSDKVAKLHKYEVQPEWMLKADQVICGRNDTRFDTNNLLRKLAGFDVTYPFPTSDQEKIICLKNNRQEGLINGMFMTLHDIETVIDITGAKRFTARMKDESGEWLGSVRTKKGEGPKMPIYTGHFLDHVDFDKDRNDRDWKTKKGLVEATFGWVVTCHKFQGSQAQNIIVIDDHLGQRDKSFRKQWLYTAITRAEEGLIIVD
jgi:exodeoxyribonuclease-5